MKLLWIGLLTLMTQARVQAQYEQITLTPGVGIGNIKLGMTKGQLRKLIGAEVQPTDFLGEMKLHKQFDRSLRVDSIPQYVIGFDECWTLPDSIQESLPVFKVYFKKNQLVFISVTSYGNTEEVSKERVIIGKQTRFFDEWTICRGQLGEDFVSLPYDGYDCYLYSKLGLEFMFDQDALRFVGIFKPTVNFGALIRSRSSQLLSDWGKITVE